jgi:hypothetical protein
MACVKFSRSSHGTVGCTVGLAPHVFVGAYGEDPADALHRASGIAAELSKVLKDTPALAMLRPPQVTAAMKAIEAASAIAKTGGKPDDIAKAVGPAAASIVTTLLRSVL